MTCFTEVNKKAVDSARSSNSEILSCLPVISIRQTASQVTSNFDFFPFHLRPAYWTRRYLVVRDIDSQLFAKQNSLPLRGPVVHRCTLLLMFFIATVSSRY